MGDEEVSTADLAALRAWRTEEGRLLCPTHGVLVQTRVEGSCVIEACPVGHEARRWKETA